MSKLFPLGDIAADTAYGQMNGNNYYMFEPNSGCESKTVYTNLTTLFETQFRLIRKKADPYLTITYMYEDIYSKEFNQIDYFINEVNTSPTSFYVVDWSKGTTLDTVSSGWVCTVADDKFSHTRLYSKYDGQRAYRALVWNGVNWKLGYIEDISNNTNINLSVSEGTLTYSDANTSSMVYPVYEVYLQDNPTEGFETTGYIPYLDVDRDGCGGPIYSGEINFISKYKV